MILRRVTQHVRDQNWFAVGVDFLIVVIGVFIGIQVSNWNAVRGDRADERAFLERLHGDIMEVEQNASRVRYRRLDVVDHLYDAATVLFSDDPGAVLTDEHCYNLGISHYYNIRVSGLPSLVELTSAGRVGIIRNQDLRDALISYQMDADSLRDIILFDTGAAHNLIMLRPELIRAEAYFAEDLNEYQQRYSCDLEGMRADPVFMNAVSESIDSYDAYLRDGLRPWSDQLEHVHTVLDEELGINHD